MRAIAGAKKAVRVQAYAFTSERIARALVEAKARGVAVEVLLDKSNRTARHSVAGLLADAGIAVLIDDKHAIAHNKVILIDDNVVITGSFNFTKSAETRNAENLLFIRRYPRLFAAYLADFERHREHSVPYRESESRCRPEGGRGISFPFCRFPVFPLIT